jgi:peptidoglycan-associated lipoprotein
MLDVSKLTNNMEINMKKILSTLAIAGILMGGCAHKGIVKETEPTQPQKQMSASEQAQKQSNANQRQNRGSQQEDVTSKEVSGAASKTAPGDVLSMIREMQKKMQDIHFDFDKYAIHNEDKPALERVAQILRTNSGMKVDVEGNCDERGTIEYNLALGDRRATAAKEYLTALGIQPGRMDTVSYGKEKPLCTEHNEACWAKNRRDHFVVEEGKR